MVEEGLVRMIQAGVAGSPPSLTVPGGFFAELPKDTISAAAPMAWSYRSILSEPEFVLGSQTSWVDWTVQIDCHGFTAKDAIRLARAVDGVLRGGFEGTLSDADHTKVRGIFRQAPQVDGYNDANRTYVRSLEYLVQYLQI